MMNKNNNVTIGGKKIKFKFMEIKNIVDRNYLRSRISPLVGL